MRGWGLLIAIAMALAGTAVPTAPPTWTSCFASRAECAAVTVPVDHGAPDGPKIDIAVARLPMKGAGASRGTIIMHPGGPLPALTERFFSEENLGNFDDLRRWYDLVLFDSRGYGKSAGLCDPALAPIPAAEFTTRAAFTKNREAAAAYAESCKAGNPLLAAHATSQDVAEDIDLIRTALGEDKILFYGNSYGTVFGQEYARLHGEHLSRLLLDSVADHTTTFLDRAGASAQIMEQRVPDFARWCTSDPGCALHDADPTAVYDEVVAAADRKPLPTKDGAVVTGTAVRVFTMLLVFPSARVAAAAALVQARAGDGTGIAALQATAGGRGMDAGQLTECADFPVVPDDITQLSDAAQQLRRTAPRVGWLAPLISAWKCIGWTIPAGNPPAPLHAPDAPPALLVNSTLDHATTTIEAQHVADQLPDSAVLPVIGMNHAAYWSGRDNRCVRDIVHHYLLDGAMPRPGTTCPAGLPPNG